MNAILEFFSNISETVANLIAMVASNLKSMAWIALNLDELVAGFTGAMAYAPTFVFQFLQLSLSVLLVFALLRIL